MMTFQDLGTVPPGGYQHTEKETGMPFPEPGEKRVISDFDQLVGMVKRHREAYGGDLEPAWVQRLIHEMCEAHPEWRCKHEAPYLDRHLTLADAARFLNTAKQWRANGGEFVSQEEAERRAAICVSCPWNGHVTGCWGCGTLLGILFDLMAGRSTSLDGELRSCQNCGCVLRCKVWLPLDVIDNDGVGEWPEWCWNRQG